jgi:hypothetical protein
LCAGHVVSYDAASGTFPAAGTSRTTDTHGQADWWVHEIPDVDPFGDPASCCYTIAVDQGPGDAYGFGVGDGPRIIESGQFSIVSWLSP